MKHVDTRYHFVQEYIEKGIVKIVFVCSEDNKKEFIRKKLGNELYAEQTRGMFEMHHE